MRFEVFIIDLYRVFGHRGRIYPQSQRFIFVVVLLTIEYLARRRQRFFEKSSGQNMLQSETITFTGKLICFIICLLPITLGFIIPVIILLNFVLNGFSIINFS